jgi:hypothetical protein
MPEKKREPNAGSFKPRDPRIRALKEKAGEIPIHAPEAITFNVKPELANTLYEDMRFVRRNPKTLDTTEGQKDCRRWKENDLKGFLSKFADLEKAQKEPEKSEAYLKDLGADHVEGLSRELLDTAKRRTLQARLDHCVTVLKEVWDAGYDQECVVMLRVKEAISLAESAT